MDDYACNQDLEALEDQEQLDRQDRVDHEEAVGHTGEHLGACQRDKHGVAVQLCRHDFTPDGSPADGRRILIGTMAALHGELQP